MRDGSRADLPGRLDVGGSRPGVHDRQAQSVQCEVSGHLRQGRSGSPRQDASPIGVSPRPGVAARRPIGQPGGAEAARVTCPGPTTALAASGMVNSLSPISGAPAVARSYSAIASHDRTWSTRRRVSAGRGPGTVQGAGAAKRGSAIPQKDSGAACMASVYRATLRLPFDNSSALLVTLLMEQGAMAKRFHVHSWRATGSRALGQSRRIMNDGEAGVGRNED